MASLKAAAYTAILLHAARRITRKLIRPARKSFAGNGGSPRPFFLYLTDGSRYWPLYLSCSCSPLDAFHIESKITYRFRDRLFGVFHEKRSFILLPRFSVPTEDPNELAESLGYAESSEMCDILISAKEMFQQLAKGLN